MQYYYFNKIAMAVLVALLLFFGTRTLIDIAYQEHPPEKPGYEVAGADGDEHGGKEKPADENAEFILALSTADPAKGEQDVGLCKVCHGFEKGGPTMIGPNLYGVVGHKIASHEGVNYTPALKAHGDQEWTFENLNKWLTNPQTFAPGTSMAFPGIPDVKKRAEVIAYLNKNSDSPLPLPEPKAEAAAPEEAGAEGGEKEAAAGGSKIVTLLASADAARGEQGAALCKVCHTFEEGGATVVGPNLHNVVGHKIAAHEGFTYTPALKAHGDDTWTYEHLDAWLTNPQAFAPGTTMAFPGIPDDKKRADVIKFLMSMTENPPPLPVAGEVAPAEAAPAEEPKAEEPAAEEAAPAEEPAAEESAPAEEPAAEEPAAEDAAPAEEPAAEEAAPAEEPAAEEPAAEEPAPAEEPAAEEAAPAEEPAAEEPAAEEPAAEEAAPAEEPAAEEAAPAEEPAAEEEPEAVMEEETMEETIVVPPTVSEDAPSEPSTGEGPSASQPQPVYPEDESGVETGDDASSNGASSDADAEDTDGSADDSLSSQPQPVYPDGAPGAETEDDASNGASSDAAAEDTDGSADDSLSSQPQPVYPDGKPEGL